MRRAQNLKKSPTCFDKTAVFTQQRQNKWEIFSIHCGLLRKPKLYYYYFFLHQHVSFIIQCNSGNNVNLGLGRMGSEITDDTVEPLAFAVCNTDGVEGLSWAEVEQCEVSKNKYENIKSEYCL